MVSTMLDHARGEQHRVERTTIRVIETSADLDALEPAWRRLHDACGDVSAFMSFEWMRTWWRHHGETNRWARLHVLVLESDGLCYAIAPFYVHTFRPLRLFRLRQLRLLGHIISDYSDLLVLPGFEDATSVAIGNYLRSARGFDTMTFLSVPEKSVLRTRIAPDLWRSGWLGMETIDELCPRTPLLGTWDATLATFSDTWRKKIPALDRKVRKNYQNVSVRRVQPGEDPTAALNEFMDMHQSRWVRAGKRGAFALTRTREFHLDVARRFHERGWLVLTFLELDGKPVTANYSFKTAGRLQFYLSGANEDDAARKFAPGLLLHAYNMQMMIEEGVHTYDFLRGTERYKYDLGAHDERAFRLGLVRDSFWIKSLNRLQRARNRAGDRAKKMLMAMLAWRAKH